MGRPRKKPEDRKDYKLRVPLNEAQRELINRAAELAHEDKAEWARTILLEAARRSIPKNERGENDKT